MNSAMNERRKDVSHFTIFFRGCACNPQDSRIERPLVRRPVVVGQTRSLPFVFLCHADAPSPGSTDGNSAEAHGESQKLQSSTCGGEMLADVGLSLPSSWP